MRGRKPKPHLQAVREGNPGKRRPREGLALPPGAPPEPDWREWFGVTRGDQARANQQARADARACWLEIVQDLDEVGILATIDATVLADTCVCRARIRQCERLVSVHGVTVDGARGPVRNPALAAANQYRQQLRFYCSELGLTPVAMARLNVPARPPDEGDNPFDV